MSAHTPGPWVVTPDALHPMGRRVWGGGRQIAKAYASDLSTDDAAANARLIAAAPELLAELSHLVRLLEPQERGGTLAVPGLATLNAARAAIAKATGEGA